MGDISWTLLGILVSIFIYYYIKMKQKYKYWSNRGVAHVKPLPFVGNALPTLLRQVPLFEGGLESYIKFPNERVVGTYFMSQLSLLIRDPKIIERVFVKDFHHFTDHNGAPEQEDSLFSLAMFNLKGNKWRAMRNKLVPTFTTGRIKNMFEQMVVCADNFVENVKYGGLLESNELIKFITSYTTDISSSVIFGIEIKDKLLREEYKKYSSSVFELPVFKFFFIVISQQIPLLRKLLNISFLNPECEQFFRGLIEETFTQRKKTGFTRNDYVQLLLQLKEKGHVEVKQKDPDDNYLKIDEISSREKIELTDDLLTAQAFQFLFAGFEPVNNCILCLLFELSQNEGIQTKVRNEIAKSVQIHGSYTYMALKDMKYLEQCIQETLRKYPIIPTLTRLCVKDYVLDENLTVEKGTQVVVSVLGLHHDPNYFPEPEKFNPDRFSTDAALKNFVYLPFGGGPRTCIAMRFAMLETKLAAAKFLEHFSVELNPETKIPLEYSKYSFFMCPLSVYFNLTRIK